MQILMNTGGVAVTNCFVIGDETTNQAVLFDAPNGTVAPMLDEVVRRGWELIGLWLTHGHFDHVADHEIVNQRFPGAEVLIHELDAPKLRNPKMSAFVLPFTIPPREPDALLFDGQTLRIGSLEVEVIHTPGHSPGHCVFHLPRHKRLVSGDLILEGSIGRTDLPDSSQADMDASIKKIMKLPADTRLLPGHGDISTLAEEQKANPFVREILGIK